MGSSSKVFSGTPSGQFGFQRPRVLSFPCQSPSSKQEQTTLLHFSPLSQTKKTWSFYPLMRINRTCHGRSVHSVPHPNQMPRNETNARLLLQSSRQHLQLRVYSTDPGSSSSDYPSQAITDGGCKLLLLQCRFSVPAAARICQATTANGIWPSRICNHSTEPTTLWTNSSCDSKFPHHGFEGVNDIEKRARRERRGQRADKAPVSFSAWRFRDGGLLQPARSPSALSQLSLNNCPRLQSRRAPSLQPPMGM